MIAADRRFCSRIWKEFVTNKPATAFRFMWKTRAAVSRCSCSMGGRILHISGATRSHSSSISASRQSRRTCVASDTPIAPKEWARILCRTRSAVWSAFLTGVRYRRSGHRWPRLGSRRGVVHGARTPRSPYSPRRSPMPLKIAATAAAAEPMAK
jgi:hypothetical protein